MPSRIEPPIDTRIDSPIDKQSRQPRDRGAPLAALAALLIAGTAGGAGLILGLFLGPQPAGGDAPTAAPLPALLAVAATLLTALLAAATWRVAARWRRRRNDRPASGAESAEASCLAAVLDTLEKLVEDPRSSRPFEDLLRCTEHSVGARGSAIFVLAEGQPALFAATEGANLGRLQAVAGGQLREAAEPGASRGAEPGAAQLLRVEQHAYAAVALGEAGGENPAERALLLLELSPAATRGRAGAAALDDTALALLATLRGHLARAIGCARRARVRHRRDLHEERAAIARELHDSLAQSLSYLKIQAARLDARLRREPAAGERGAADDGELEAISRELRDKLKLAYSQLRELMTTFRLTMNGRSLSQAIEESLEEFRSRSSIVFSSDLRLDDDLLGAHEELQVLHIVREGLANVVRHAHASRASVSLHQRAANRVALTIRDDGVGIAAKPDLHQHHGMMIMQERARALRGELSVHVSPAIDGPRQRPGGSGGGTSIEVEFTPQCTAAAPARTAADKGNR